jgi:solute carrier family 35, member C2
MGFSNPIATLFWLAPIMAVVLGICSIIFEGPGNIFGDPTFFGSFGLGLQTMALTVMPGIIAFFMTSSEFMCVCNSH